MKTALILFILNIPVISYGFATEEKLPHGFKSGHTAGGAPFLSDSNGRRITDTVFMALVPDPQYPLIWARQKPFDTIFAEDTLVSGVGSWILLDTLGKRLSDAVYDYPTLFESGMSVCRRGGLLGSVDSSGKTLIPFEFDDIQALQYGFYAVRKQGATGVIRSNGILLWEPEPARISDFIGPHLLAGDSLGRITLLDSNGSFIRDVFGVSGKMQVPVSKLLPLTDGETETVGIEIEGLSLLSKIKNPQLFIRAENILLEMGCKAMLDEQGCRKENPIVINYNLLLHQTLNDREVYFAILPEWDTMFVCSERAYALTSANQNSFCLQEMLCMETFNLNSGPVSVGCSNRFYNYRAAGDSFSLLNLNDVFKPAYESELERLLKEALGKTEIQLSELCPSGKLLECCGNRYEIMRDGIRFHFPLILRQDEVLTEEELIPVFLNFKSLRQILKSQSVYE